MSSPFLREPFPSRRKATSLCCSRRRTRNWRRGFRRLFGLVEHRWIEVFREGAPSLAFALQHMPPPFTVNDIPRSFASNGVLLRQGPDSHHMSVFAEISYFGRIQFRRMMLFARR